MSSSTKIEWTRSDDGTAGATWNPVTGCTEVSPGCDRCYAKTFAERWRGTPGHYYEHGFDVQLRPDKLDQPLRWTRPRRIFVNSMSDLFHDQVSDAYIATVWAVMALSPHHTFQVLSKRHGRMRSLLSSVVFDSLVRDEVNRLLDAGAAFPNSCEPEGHRLDWPLSNVWLGVSAENQMWADIRIPALLDTPAAVRFVSAEPLLGPIDLIGQLCETCDADVEAPQCNTCYRRWWIRPDRANRIDWVIVGGESGPGARPMHPDWARSLRDQCRVAGTAFFFKQWGNWIPQPDQGAPRNNSDHLVFPDGGSVRAGHAGHRQLTTPGIALMRHTSKRDAGRVLDGRTWDEFPTPETGKVG
jgi:protein gp37